ncbi:phage/plasmid primase, P4 family [Chloroflexota bacterium]
MSAKIRGLDDFLALLKGVKQLHEGQFMTLCPGHHDTNPSLSIKEAGGNILLKCHAGCELDDILKPLGLQPKDLFLSNHSLVRRIPKKPIVTFSYEMEKGKEAYQIRRFNLGNGKKTFEAWHSENGKYVSGMGEYKGKPILYHKPEIPGWIAASKPIYIPEGESKADCLISLGFAATTSPFGAGQKKWRPEYAKTLTGADVIILPDNDRLGREFAEIKAKNLYGTAKSVKVVELPGLGDKEDIIDWLNAGHTKDELLKIEAETTEWQPGSETGYLQTGMLGTGIFNLTDMGNAERLDDQFGDWLHYCYERNLWLVWNGKVWEWDMGSKITAFAKLAVRNIYSEAANESDKEKRSKLVDHAKSSESDHRIKAMISMARSEPGIPVHLEDLDKDLWLLNIKNGTIDLKTGLRKSHDPLDLITKIVPVDYDPKAHSKVWEKFLACIFTNKDLNEFVQRSAGYSITGDQSEQAFFFCHGGGWNGKSTLLGAIRNVLGPYSYEVEPSVFMVNKNQSGPNEAIASLYGKRFVCSTEIEDGQRLSITLIKRMTGGEELRCERKYEHGFSFKPNYKLWLSGNHEPTISDTTNSIWNRVKKIPFTSTISSEDRIKGFADILSRDHGKAILAWLVKGCLEWQKQGLGEPVEVIAATQEYRESQDILHDFLNECCLFKKSEAMPVSELYKLYKAWCDENDTYCIGKNKFRDRLIEKGLRTIPGSANKTLWQGIRALSKDEKVNSVNLVSDIHVNSYTKENTREVLGNGLPKLTELPKSDSNDSPSSTLDSKSGELALGLGQSDQGSIELGLGMSIGEAVAIWRREGCQVIHLGPGENCYDLEKLLSHREIKTEHLAAIRNYLKKH